MAAGSYVVVNNTGGSSSSSLPSQGGANDAANYAAGSYYWNSDLVGQDVSLVNPGYAGTGAYGIGYSSATGNDPNSYGVTYATLANREGWFFVGVSAVSDTAYGSVNAAATGSTIFPSFAGSITINYVILLSAASTSSQRYQYYIGPAYASGATPTHGLVLGYSDNVNSGNWVLSQYVSGTATVLSNTSAAPVAFGSFFHLSFVVSANQVSVYQGTNGSSLSQIVTATSVPRLNGGADLYASAGYQGMAKSVGTGNVCAVMDYLSWSVTGLTRT